MTRITRRSPHHGGGGIPRTSRRVLVVGAAAVAVSVIAGCTSAPSDDDAETTTIRMTWWGGDERSQIYNAALDLFEEKNPGIVVEREPGGEWGDYWDRLGVMTAAGDAPDVIQMSTSYVVEYGGRGALLDLATFVGGTISVDDRPEGVLDPYVTDAGVFGLPWTGNTITVLYNDTVLSAAGLEPPTDNLEDWTWEAFRDLAQQISDDSPEGVYGARDVGATVEGFSAWLGHKGKTYFEGDQLGFDQSDLEEFWTFSYGMVQSGAATPPEISALAPVPETNTMAQNQVGLAVDYSNAVVTLTEVGGGPDKIDLQLHRLPGEYPTASQSVRASLLLSAASSSEHPEEAAKLLDFLMNDAEAAEILGTDGGTPLNQALAAEVAESLNEVQVREVDFISANADQFGPAAPLYPVGGGEIDAIYLSAYENVLFGRSTPAEAAASVFEQATQILGD